MLDLLDLFVFLAGPPKSGGSPINTKVCPRLTEWWIYTLDRLSVAVSPLAVALLKWKHVNNPELSLSPNRLLQRGADSPQNVLRRLLGFIYAHVLFRWVWALIAQRGIYTQEEKQEVNECWKTPPNMALHSFTQLLIARNYIELIEVFHLCFSKNFQLLNDALRWFHWLVFSFIHIVVSCVSTC